jgi:lycopene cyclase domain-containing protein
VSLLYLTSLAIAIFGMVMIDRRYRLAFFLNARRTVLTLGIAVVVFVAWDVLGIALGIFRQGASVYDLGIEVLPELPVEEFFFLFLLCYLSLLCYLLLAQRMTR